MRRRVLVVGIDPEGNRFERLALDSEVIFGWGPWAFRVLTATQRDPVRVDGYTVWCEQ